VSTALPEIVGNPLDLHHRYAPPKLKPDGGVNPC
jgi:hypothetical protein